MKTQEETSTNRHTFINTTPYCLWILNHQGEILDANSSLTAILGYPRDEMIGRSVVFLYPDIHQKDIHEQIQLLKCRDFVLYERPVVGPTGVSIHFETIMFKGIWKSEPALFGYCRPSSGQKTDFDEPSFLLSCDSLEPDHENFFNMATLALKEIDTTRKELIAGKEKIIKLTNDYTARLDREIQERKYLEKENAKKNILLAEKNITLKQLLDQREKEKQEIRDEIYKKVQSLILPLIGRIQGSGTDVDKRYLQAILNNLQEIISPLSSETQKKCLLFLHGNLKFVT